MTDHLKSDFSSGPVSVGVAPDRDVSFSHVDVAQSDRVITPGGCEVPVTSWADVPLSANVTAS